MINVSVNPLMSQGEDTHTSRQALIAYSLPDDFSSVIFLSVHAFPSIDRALVASKIGNMKFFLIPRFFGDGFWCEVMMLCMIVCQSPDVTKWRHAYIPTGSDRISLIPYSLVLGFFLGSFSDFLIARVRSLTFAAVECGSFTPFQR